MYMHPRSIKYVYIEWWKRRVSLYHYRSKLVTYAILASTLRMVELNELWLNENELQGKKDELQHREAQLQCKEEELQHKEETWH